MAESQSLKLKGPGRVLEEATSPCGGTAENSRLDSQSGARRRKIHEYDPYIETRDGTIRREPTQENADAFCGKLRVDMPDGTHVDLRRETSVAFIPERFWELSRNGQSLKFQDTNDSSRFAEHYISLTRLPQYRNFDTTAYLLSKEHRNKKNTSKLEVPILYQGYDQVTDPKVRVALFLIAEKCQFLDRSMAELFKALLRSLPKDLVEGLLSRAKDKIAKSDPSRPSTQDVPSLERSSSRERYLGELGHHLEAICRGETREFMIHRVGEQRLGYLQDALELPYWDLIVDLFESASTTRQASGIGQAITENAIGGTYQFIKGHLEYIKNRYINGDIDEVIPERVLEGIALRLHVLEQYSRAVDTLRPMDDISLVGTGDVSNKMMSEEPVTGVQGQVLTFSILFVVLAVAMVPGMMGFAKATQDGEMGSISDADFTLAIRDTIMTTLGAVLSTVQMFGSPRKNSAYTMAWVFSGFAVSLGVTAVVLYPLTNKAYSSLCGFFAQFFSIASLAILALDKSERIGDGAPRKAEMGGASIKSDRKKNR